MIAIIDYGMGNLGSVKNMFKRLGFHQAIVTSEIEQIEKAEKLILPGVGSFDKAMNNLLDGGYVPIIEKNVIEQHKPIMGICLGMQLLFEWSEEGECKGLGLIKGKVSKFKNFNEKLNIPQMGWNVAEVKKSSNLTDDLFNVNKFYFVHSYHANCIDKEDILMTTKYGYEFTSAVQKRNISGFQFHPEKSHKYGMKIFENFLKI